MVWFKTIIMIAEIISRYAEATIEEFENSSGISSYKVYYNNADKQEN